MSYSKAVVSIVEDDMDIKNLFYDALCHTFYGLSIVKFCDSFLALNDFKRNKENYILVIADWKMPKLDGLELLTRIKKSSPNVKSILITAYEVEREPKFDKLVQNRIIDKFIQKPVKMNYLCQEVNKQIQDSTNSRSRFG